MRKISTIILGVTSLVLAVVISAVESGSDGRGRFSNQLLRFNEKSVDSVTLMRGGQTVVMKKIQNYWFFVSPDQERINSNSMEALLDKLNHLIVLDRLESSELSGEMSLTNLGLEGEEVLQVIIESKDDGKSQIDKLLIGRPTPRENSVYAGLFDGKKIKGAAVVNGNPHDILDSPYETLMERQLVNVPPSGLVQISVKTPESSVVLQRNIKTQETTPWILLKPIQAKADQGKVEDLVASILALQISDVASAEDSAMQIPDPLPLDSALIQFRVLGAEKPIVLYLNKFTDPNDDFGPPLLTARISDRPATYQLNSMLLNSFEASADSLRDRRLGNVPEQVLDSIAIVSKRPVSEVFLKANRNQQGVNWAVLINGKQIDANYAKIKQLVDQMNEPVIIDFVENGKPSDYGIDPNQEGSMAVAFNFKLPGKVKDDGTVGEPEDFAKVLRLGWKKAKPRRLFANFQGDPHIFELEPGFATLLPTHPIKWRSLSVLSFNPFHLKKITKTVQSQGEIDLIFNKNLGTWDAIRSDGTNVTGSLDRAMADTLRDRLSSLKAIGWNLNVGEGYAALQNPTAVFTIVTRELDPAINQVTDVTRVLRLADSKGIVYGRIDESPDLFFLDRDKFKALIQPLTSFSAD